MIVISVTWAELAAAKAFRTAQRALLEGKNASDPPDITASVLVHHVRHDCAAKGGKSVSLELREHYAFSPRYLVTGGEAVPAGPGTGTYVPALAAEVPGGRFGFIFTEGRCGCGMTARSGDSRLVDPAVRPPSPRAVVVQPIPAE